MITETEILKAVIEYLNGECENNQNLQGFSPIVMGETTAGKASTSAEIAPGYAKSTYLDNGALQRMPILLIIREQNRQRALETAFTLADAVRNGAKLTTPLHEKIAGISMGTGPEFVQKNGADCIYSLMFNIDYII